MAGTRAVVVALVLATTLQVPTGASAVPSRPGGAVAVPSRKPAAPAHPSGPTRINDVDGDGRVDIVGLDEGSEGAGRVGGVRVLFASGKVQTITREQLGDPVMTDTQFGAGFTVADLDFDGYADVLVSDWTMDGYRGVVWAIRGSADGISADRVIVIARGTEKHPIGSSLAFVPEPQPVLAVGVPSSPDDGPGGVMLYRVGPTGRLGAHRYVTLGSPGITRAVGGGSTFGRTMASAGDLLVLGASDTGPRDASGSAWVFQLLPGLKYWVTRVAQDRWGLPGRPEDLDQFGTDVSVVDDTVAVSVPGETVRGARLKGAVEWFRVERTGHGLRIHPGRLISTLDSGQQPEIDPIEGRGAQVMVGPLCPGGYAVVINAGPVAIPLDASSDCRPQLPSGIAFTLLRGQSGVDRPAVLKDDTFTVGTLPDTSSLEAASDLLDWSADHAAFAAPAA